jgi:hypothetical protein
MRARGKGGRQAVRSRHSWLRSCTRQRQVAQTRPLHLRRPAMLSFAHQYEMLQSVLIAGASWCDSVVYTSMGTSATTDRAVSQARAVATSDIGDTLGAAYFLSLRGDHLAQRGQRGVPSGAGTQGQAGSHSQEEHGECHQAHGRGVVRPHSVGRPTTVSAPTTTIKAGRGTALFLGALFPGLFKIQREGRTRGQQIACGPLDLLEARQHLSKHSRHQVGEKKILAGATCAQTAAAQRGPARRGLQHVRHCRVSPSRQRQ